MDDDDELDDCLSDVEDVINGRVIDMAHAELMMPLTEACADLETELDFFMKRRRGMPLSIE